MNKQELAEQIAKKHISKTCWNEYFNRHVKESVLAAIVEAMGLPATEDVVSIYRFQLKAIESALFTVANQYKCREQKTCLDRMVTQAEQFATNALKGEMEKTVRYGQAAPAKEVEAISELKKTSE